MRLLGIGSWSGPFAALFALVMTTTQLAIAIWSLATKRQLHDTKFMTGDTPSGRWGILLLSVLLVLFAIGMMIQTFG